MPTFELTDDEFDTLREAFNDVGCDCPGVDWDKYKTLGVKFGFWEAEKPPTEEELKRREEVANSPFGIMMKELFNNTCENIFHDTVKFFEGEQWDTKNTIGSQLRIRLPNDFNVKDT